MMVLLRGSSNTEHWRWIGVHSDIDTEYDGGKAMLWNGIVADGAWHYSCFNLQVAIDGLAISGDDKFTAGDAHEVLNLKFFNNEVARSTYGENPFWIDEFSISPVERMVSQTSYPDVPSGPLQVVDVVRKEDAAEVAWEMTLSTDDVGCNKVENGLALDFALDVEGVQNFAAAEIHQVEQHSEPLAGHVILGFGEGSEYATVEVDPYASASEVQSKLGELPALGQTKVLARTGSCQAGFGWIVQFLTRPGDQPMMYASLSLSAGRELARVTVHEVQAGGVLIQPLPADYFHRIAHAPGVHLTVNGALADCNVDANNASLCRFAFNNVMTPSFTATSQKQNEVGTYLITFSGSRLVSPDDEPPVIHAAGFPCPVQSSTASEVICKITRPFVPAGQHDVTLVVPTYGAAANLDGSRFDYGLEVTAVTPSNFDPRRPITITIHGAGFDPVAANNTISVGDTTCATTFVNASQLVCRLAISSGSTRRSSHTGITVGAGFGTVSADDLATFTELDRPQVIAISPTAGSVGGGDIATISGANFVTPDHPDVTVFLGQTPCDLLSSNATVITCTTRASAPGAVQVAVENLVRGVSDASGAPSYEYVLAVSSVSPSRIGLGGGVTLTVQGDGLVAASGTTARASVSIAGLEVYNVGVYQGALVHEKHALALTGSYVDEVQRLDLTAASETIKIRLAGESRGDSAEIAKTAAPHVFQEEINKVLLHGSVQVTKQQQVLTITFRGMGDVPLLQVLSCPASGACSVDSSTVATVESSGAAPAGSFRLRLPSEGNLTTEDISIVATGCDVQESLSKILAGGVKVTRKDNTAGGVTWEVTYLEFQGKRTLPVILQESLVGGALSVTRMQEGTSRVQGSFTISMDASSVTLPVDASSQQVEDAVASFPSVNVVDVISANNLPGRLLDRDYPVQWAIRMTRMGVAGLGVERCTSPLYIDWDPAACPGVAADLFLNHYKWYFPSGLPQPADLGEAAAIAALQTLCDAEAVSLNLKPGRCQVEVPAETLPVCGQGSGVNPPCWQTRFTVAKVCFLVLIFVYYHRASWIGPSIFSSLLFLSHGFLQKDDSMRIPGAAQRRQPSPL